jgi:hypothetical protein
MFNKSVMKKRLSDGFESPFLRFAFFRLERKITAFPKK